MENTFKKLGLQAQILEALSNLGYNIPSEVQEEVIPYVMDDRDVIVKSQTGSGKTAAFGIPVCEKIEAEAKNTQALVLVPTRELAVQVKEELANIGRYKKLRCSAIFGKQPMAIQIRELKQRVHIVVSTPGRCYDHITRGSLNLSEIRYLIIDEADKMLSMGFIEQIESIIEALPNNRITMLFSATIPEEISELCGKYMKEPVKIEVEHKNTTSSIIDQYYYEIDENRKFNLLTKIIYTFRPDSAIIFCNTKEAVDRLTVSMKNEGYSVNSLHGGMEQKDRLSTMKSFKHGEFDYLVATDVAARGIHIEEISLVLNYDIPRELESYIHRIGRTGRAGSTGLALTFVTPYEMKYLRELEEFIGYRLDRKDIPDEEESESGKKIYKNIVRKTKLNRNQKAAKSNVTKIYINAGKKKKLRALDIVGAISSIEGISGEDIGIIDIQDNVSYVDILRDKGDIVLRELKNKTIKGKKVRAEKATTQD